MMGEVVMTDRTEDIFSLPALPESCYGSTQSSDAARPDRSAAGFCMRGVAMRTLEDVRYALAEAADTLRRLPIPKGGFPAGVKAGWPDVVHDWMAYAYNPVFIRKAPPSPAAIGRLDDTLSWLYLLTREQRMVLWARAQGWTWRKIEALDDAERVGRGRQERQLRTICGDAEARILSHLNGTPKRMVLPVHIGCAA